MPLGLRLIRRRQGELSARIGLKVTVKATGSGGTLSIAYRTLDQLGRKLVQFELEPSWLKVPSIALSAMRA